MNTTTRTHAPEVTDAARRPLKPGSWHVDPDESSARFSARGFWGAVPVKGGFNDLAGTATPEPDGRFKGELVIRAGTLSTGLWFRDLHLKSRQFFHVRRYTEIRFVVEKLRPSDGGHVIHGRLCVRDRSVQLALPVQVAEAGNGRVTLTAEAALDRGVLGVGHSPAGMIRGPADVRVHIVLESAK